jgi:hypothetical protein
VQWWNLSKISQAVEQVTPEGNIKLLASFLYAQKGVTCLASGITSGGSTDFSFFHIITNIVFTQIVMERDLRSFEDQQ